MALRSDFENIIPSWASKVLITIVGAMFMYFLNQKSSDIEDVKKENKELRKELNLKLDLIIKQNSDVQGDIKVVNMKLVDFETKFGDHERRLRELEIKEARRG